MKESVAIAKEADRKKDISSTRSGNSIHRVRNEPERPLGSLRDVIGNITRNGGTPSVESISTELSSMHSAQRAPALLALQRTHGNRYVQRVVAGIQAKLKVGPPGDIYEQEADRVAEEVMRMPEPQMQRQPGEEEEKIQTTQLAEQITPLVQRQVEEEEEEKIQTKKLPCQTPSVTINEELRRQSEEEEEEEKLQAKALPSQLPDLTPNLEARINAIKGGGQPLPKSLQNFFEPRFGYDFTQIRMHTDAEADMLNHALNSQAFTIGQTMFFRQGAYKPDSLSGRKLLAHELTHAIQQNGRGAGIQLIQRDLREDIEDFLDEERGSLPRLTSASNREQIIRRLLEMQPETNTRVMERRRFLWEVFRTIRDPIEAQSLHETLEARSEDISQLFHGELHSALCADLLRLLRGIFEPGERVVEAAESFPSGMRFGGFGGGMRFNEGYWVVTRVGRTMEITIGQHGAAAAIRDLFENPLADELYALECLTAAALTELRGIQLFYQAEEREALFDEVYATFRIEFDGTRPRTNLVQLGSYPDEPGLREHPSQTALEQGRSFPQQYRYPLRAESQWRRVIQPGDWVILSNGLPHNHYLSPPWETENAIYLGGNRFSGHPLGTFTLEEYARYLHRPWTNYLGRGAQRRDDWPAGQEDIPSDWRSHLQRYAVNRAQYGFNLTRPWAQARGDVINYIGENTVVLPRARARVILPPRVHIPEPTAR
jgi:hypothetical protein